MNDEASNTPYNNKNANNNRYAPLRTKLYLHENKLNLPFMYSSENSPPISMANIRIIIGIYCTS